MGMALLKKQAFLSLSLCVVFVIESDVYFHKNIEEAAILAMPIDYTVSTDMGTLHISHDHV